MYLCNPSLHNKKVRVVDVAIYTLEKSLNYVLLGFVTVIGTSNSRRFDSIDVTFSSATT
jgi:hypothetical protein